MNPPPRSNPPPSPIDTNTDPDDGSVAGEEDPGAALDDFSLPSNPDVDPPGSQPLPSDHGRDPAAPGP